LLEELEFLPQLARAFSAGDIAVHRDFETLRRKDWLSTHQRTRATPNGDRANPAQF
jgi:hypothetical protein